MKTLFLILVCMMSSAVLAAPGPTGNGEVGSAGDEIFSITDTLHETYNSQYEAMTMPKLCKLITSGTVRVADCKIRCLEKAGKIAVMEVSAVNQKTQILEFQKNDKTLVTYWGSDEEHEYLNSKNTYMRAFLIKINNPIELALTITSPDKSTLFCGVLTH